MAENLSALELVPRGVEGTGKATILGNEQTLNSLARLSGRLDNLAKLRAYTAAKTAAAKQPKPTEPKTYTDISSYPTEGIFGVEVASDNAFDDNRFLNEWPTMTYMHQFQTAKALDAEKRRRQAWASREQSNLEATKKELEEAGVNFTNSDITQQRNDYVLFAHNKAKEEATNKNITDLNAINNFRRNIFYNNNFSQMFKDNLLQDVGRYDLNKFGEMILKNVGTTSVQTIGSLGTGSTFTRDNIFEKVKTAGGDEIQLNVPLVALVAKNNPVSKQMFGNLTNAYLVPATNQYNGTGAKEQQDAANAYANNGFKLSGLPDATQKLVTEEVIPRAESVVSQKMMAGKGDWKVVYDNDARNKAASVSVKTGSEDKDKISTNPITVSAFGGSYNPKTKTEVKGLDSKLYVIDIGNINLGNGTTKVLQTGTYPISSGTKFYYSGAINDDLLSLIGTKKSDGSWTLKVTPKTNSITVMHDPISISGAKSPIQVTLKSGSVGYYKPGTIVKPATPGAEQFNKDGDEYGMINAESILETLDEKTKQKLLKDDKFTSLKFFIKLSDNPGVKTLLTGAYGNVSAAPSSSSTSKMR